VSVQGKRLKTLTQITNMYKYILKIEGSIDIINNIETDFSDNSDSFEIKQKDISDNRSYYSLSFETVASIVALVSNVVVLVDILFKQLHTKKKKVIKIKTPTKEIEIESSETLSKEEISRIINTFFE
jgi:hypothetical protein